MPRSPAPSEPVEVSVVIPAYNAARFLRGAVDSALAAASVAGCRAEVVVVDDGSSDDTLAVARALAAAPAARTTVVHQARGGAAAARNAGALATEGSFLAFLDADDLWTQEALGVRLAALSADPGTDLAFGHLVEFDDATGAERPAVPAWSAPAMVVRRVAFDRVGGFDPRWRVGEFLDWFARAEEAGLRSVMVPEVVLRRRVHDANTTRAHRSEYASVLAHVRRRRAAAAREAG